MHSDHYGPVEPQCRMKRISLGLPFPRSSCDKCGSLFQPGWRCVDEAFADALDRPPEAGNVSTDLASLRQVHAEIRAALGLSADAPWPDVLALATRLRADSNWRNYIPHAMAAMEAMRDD